MHFQLQNIVKVSLLLLLAFPTRIYAQEKVATKDSMVLRITYKDSVVYRYDTIVIKRYIYSDTLGTAPGLTAVNTTTKRKGWYNPNSWGIGPSIGTYYSPYHGFDINIGFGVQYYLFAVPSFRNPHMGHHRKKK